MQEKIISNQNQVVFEWFLGCSKLGSMFQVRCFYGISDVNEECLMKKWLKVAQTPEHPLFG